MRWLKQLLTLVLAVSSVTELNAQIDPNARGIAVIARARSKLAVSGAVYAASFGAACDGTTDDAPAINAATDAIRTQIIAPNGSWAIGHIGRLVLPRGTCVIKSTLNWANLYGSGFAADLWGTLIDCQVTGGTCIDMTATGQANILGLNLAGNQNFMPQYGLVLARRTESLAQGADHNFLDHPTITGYFSTAPYYNRSSETTHVEAGMFLNYQPNAYAAVFDGSNHFNFQSAFTGGAIYTPNVFSSFNENTCVTCIFSVLGTNSVAIWLGGTQRHKMINSYVNNSGGTSMPAIVMWYGNNVQNDFFYFDAHIEDQSLGAGIEFQGSSAIQIKNLYVEDPTTAQSGPYFRLGSGVGSVSMQNADIKIGLMYGTSPSWWSTPSAFTVSGQIYAGDSSYSPPASFSGMFCQTSGCTPTIVFPSTISASSISNSGGVVSITVTNASAYFNGATTAITIGTPPSGGQQAAASVATWSLLGIGDNPTTASGGTGYQVGDTLSFAQGTPTIAPWSISVAGVDTNGTVTSFNVMTGNDYSVLPPTGNTQLACGTPCHGSGMYLHNSKWRPSQISIASAGGGYTAAPAITMPPAQVGGVSATAVSALSSTMSIGAGNAQIVLNGSGMSVLGSGASLRSALPFVDQSRVRVTASGAALVIPSGTTWFAMTQNSVVAVQTLTMPTPLVDGQTVRISTIGQVSALTISPASGQAVLGWSNGSQLSANSSVTFGWDATSSNWQRLQ